MVMILSFFTVVMAWISLKVFSMPSLVMALTDSMVNVSGLTLTSLKSSMKGIMK